MGSKAEELERLGSLLERGLLTQEEFEQQKAALLADTHSAATPGAGDQQPGPPPPGMVSIRGPVLSRPIGLAAVLMLAGFAMPWFAIDGLFETVSIGPLQLLLEGKTAGFVGLGSCLLVAAAALSNQKRRLFGYMGLCLVPATALYYVGRLVIDLHDSGLADLAGEFLTAEATGDAALWVLKQARPGFWLFVAGELYGFSAVSRVSRRRGTSRRAVQASATGSTPQQDPDATPEHRTEPTGGSAEGAVKGGGSRVRLIVLLSVLAAGLVALVSSLVSLGVFGGSSPPAPAPPPPSEIEGPPPGMIGDSGMFGGEPVARPEAAGPAFDCTEEGLSGKSEAELRVLRNTVFAKHGRSFRSADLQAHFSSQPWYRPDPAYSDERLTAEDRSCVERIGRLER